MNEIGSKTPAIKQILEYAEKQIKKANDGLACEKERKSSFAYWVQWNFKQIVFNEKKLECWTSIRNAVLSGVEKEGGVSDEEIKSFLIRLRNDFVHSILMSTNKNNTNAIAVEIETIQEDALKQFIGASCISSGSLAELLFNVFQVNVRG